MKGYSRPGWFGTVNHYDVNGKKIGESRPGFFGSTNYYLVAYDNAAGIIKHYRVDKMQHTKVLETGRKSL